MTIGVGQDSFDTLKTRANSLYCGMGKALFTVVKSCKENQTVTPPAPVIDLTGTENATNGGAPGVAQNGSGQRPASVANAKDPTDLGANGME